ncbi:MAG TPA: hypothetical protein VG841_10050 [Caulobacterales bacterium]|nr:hypothetical protein [Caulobacterales bacterium]
MRFAAMCALALALSSGALAAPAQGLGPYAFGMTVEQAKATAPEAPWADHGLDGRQSSLSGGPSLAIAGADYSAWFAFQDGRLDAIRLAHEERDVTSAQCDAALSAAVLDLEAKFGPFSAPRDPFEYGVRIDTRRTAGGSEVRGYVLDSFNQRTGYATWRGEGYVQASSRFAPRGGARSPADTACAISIVIERNAAPLPPALTPPTPEAFGSAQSIDNPQWLERPDGAAFVRNLPPAMMSFSTGGDALLYCLVIEDGRLNCAVGREWPRNMWFGQAALNLSHYYRLPTEMDGAPTLGKRVFLPIHFSLPDLRTPPGVDLAPLRRLAEQQPSAGDIAAAALIETPVWTERPSGEAFARYYPPDALDWGDEGRVELDCLVQAEGALLCRLGKVEPAGEGFDLAALGVAQSFRIAPEIDGAPTLGKRVHVVVAFRIS